MNYPKEDCRYCGKPTDTRNGGYCDSICEGNRLEELRQVQTSAPTEEQYRASLPTFEELQAGTARPSLKNERQYLENRRLDKAQGAQSRLDNIRG